jgi:hypothetical protein
MTSYCVHFFVGSSNSKLKNGEGGIPPKECLWQNPEKY